MIVYLHGFRSSPASQKVQRLASHMAARGLGDRLWCEQLPIGPKAAVALAEGAIARCSVPPTLVGSSLGGFYATWLAEKHGLRAVLVNPAVVAYLSLAQFVGPQTNLYTGETFDFTPAHVAEIEALDVAQITRPERYWLLAETGDELLDYRQAVAKYQGARQTVIQGGDHSFQHFGDFLDPILEFAGLI
ncbi:MAG: YqiA/YcfP family alpha/beta fold hydrolase [Rhodocyclaceae bacterium]